jgi:hypothetical protein
MEREKNKEKSLRGNCSIVVKGSLIHHCRSSCGSSSVAAGRSLPYMTTSRSFTCKQHTRDVRTTLGENTGYEAHYAVAAVQGCRGE